MKGKVIELKKFTSETALKLIMIGLRVMGFRPPKKFRWLYYIWAIFLNSIVTLYYPLSLLINIFFLDSRKTLLSNLSVTSGVTICSLKVLNTFIKRKKLFLLCKYAGDLDKRIVGEDEKAHFQYILHRARWFFFSFAIMFGLTGVVDDLPVILATERRLIYPAWFPLDWKSSTTAFHVVHSYQVIGVYLQIVMDVTCDTYPGILFWLLKGHLRALGMRIKRIGYDSKKSGEDNYNELLQCIMDHKMCLRYFNLCQDINSRILLLQFICTQCILCMTAIYMFFHNDDFFELIYLLLYFICMVMEVSLCCYCGSKLTAESEHLTHALYSCNWTDQDMRFRKVLIIFMQQTQKSWTIMACGIVSVSLGTWLTVIKSSYSLFVVFQQIT